jgi:tyrosyl-DNA phosphodiesterase 2
VDICHPSVPGAILRLSNVHLDSLDSQSRRHLQVYILNDLLREPGCSGGVIAGDFNAIDPRDYTLVEKYGLVDAWVALHGSTAEPGSGATWGVDMDLDDGLKPIRMDKVVMLGLQPIAIEVLKPGRVSAYTHWSDHCGLHCTFAI